MYCIAPLRPLIVWSRGSPLSIDLTKTIFDGKPEQMKVEASVKMRQRTAFMVMQFGTYPITSSDNVHKRMKQQNLDYFEEPKAEPLNEFYRYIDWRCGRNMENEETRSGIIFSLHVQRNPIQKKFLLTCLAKATPTDTLMNDIDEYDNVIYHTKQNRGKWYKVHDADHVLVEDVQKTSSKQSSTEARERRDMKLKSHSGHYISKIGKLPLHAPVLECVFYHENRSLRDILHRISYTTGLQSQRNISWRIANDEIGGEIHVCGTQRLCFIGMTKEAIEHACRAHNLFPLLIAPTKYKQRMETASGGTLYTITLREIALRTIICPGVPNMSSQSLPSQHNHYVWIQNEIRKRIGLLEQGGFVNYFSVQVIGGGGVALYEVGIHLLRKDYCSVLRGYLQLEAERHPVSYDHYIQALGAPQDSLVARLEAWKSTMSAFRDCQDLQKVLQTMLRLLNQGHSWENMAERLVTSEYFSEEHVVKYFLALRAYLWNCVVNRRLQSDFEHSNDPVVRPGDIVRIHSKGADKYLRVRDEHEAMHYKIDEVVVPVIGDGLVASLSGIIDKDSTLINTPEYREYTTLMRDLGISSKSLQEQDEKGMPWGPCKSYFRPMLVKPQGMAWHLIRDPNSMVAVKSDLFCVQEGNSTLNSPLMYNQDENEKLIEAIGKDLRNPEDVLDLMKRIRHPSPLNQTPRFINFMKYIQHSADQTHLTQYTPKGNVFPGVYSPRTVHLLPYKRDDRCTLVLRFRLPSGSFAAVALREICDSIYYKNFNEMF